MGLTYENIPSTSLDSPVAVEFTVTWSEALAVGVVRSVLSLVHVLERVHQLLDDVAVLLVGLRDGAVALGSTPLSAIHRRLRLVQVVETQTEALNQRVLLVEDVDGDGGLRAA